MMPIVGEEKSGDDSWAWKIHGLPAPRGVGHSPRKYHDSARGARGREPRLLQSRQSGSFRKETKGVGSGRERGDRERRSQQMNEGKNGKKVRRIFLRRRREGSVSQMKGEENTREVVIGDETEVVYVIHYRKGASERRETRKAERGGT